MPNLARQQQSLYCSITACWKETLKDCVKSEVNNVQASNQANLALLRDVDNVDKDGDAAIIHSALTRPGNNGIPAEPATSSLTDSISKMTIGLAKANSSSDESSSSRRRSRRASPPKETRIDLEKLRRIGSSQEKVAKVKELITKQDEKIELENRKQDGLKRMDLSPTTNSGDIERERRTSKLAVEEYKYNIRKLKVSRFSCN